MRSILLILILLFTACKKDKELVPPVIQINKPVEGNAFSAGEKINVEATISSSQEKINSITINLLNASYTPVMTSIVRNVNEKSYSASEILETPSTLTSGDYYVQITASTASNQARKYVKVAITGSGSKHRVFFVVTDHSLGSELYTFDSTYNTVNRRFFQGNLSHSAISADAGLLILSFYDHNLQAISLNDYASRWQLSSFASSAATYGAVHATGSEIYVSHLQENFVRRYDAQGTGTQTINFSQSHNASYISSDESNVFFETFSGSNPVNLAVHYRISGAGKQQSLPGMDIVEMEGKNSDELFLFGNANGNAQMKLYNLIGNSYYTPHSMPAALLKDVARTDADNLLILLSNELLTYRISNNSMVPYLTVQAEKLLFDDVQNEFILVSGNTVRFFDFNSKQIKRTVTFSATVLGIEFAYLN